jgi:predicted GTPase
MVALLVEIVRLTATAMVALLVQACQTARSKTATNHAATSHHAMTVAQSVHSVTATHAQHVQVHGLKTATQTVQTAQPATTHVSQPSVAHATQTQTRRPSSRM